ncbi:molybdopterin biosynthesis protein MoeB [Novipirellula aureliae]|uniref:Molybdopterin biosynthesis protein MoeB n=1 Tax=Novipirellula aureliae TaxID=2527966 RepID=A0A5C6E5L0_9BACT|nr:rhodanese-like domain-containing protein [Novipirellula aureliae]TWU43247.1 molybdopterin biosynthesis protein MoeB [Novipirellula aureliae]
MMVPHRHANMVDVPRNASPNANMKTNRFLVASLLLVCSASTNAFSQFGGLFGGGVKVETLETSTLHKMLSERQRLVDEANQSGKKILDSNFVVVDVRSEAEVNVSIIPGAITKAQYEKDIANYRGKLVIPYCTVGGRSGAYAKKLASEGVKVKNYRGSILKWVDAGLPLVTLDGKPTNRVHTSSDKYRIPEKYEQVTR